MNNGRKETLNIGKLMRDNTTMRVGKDAIAEMISYIEDLISGNLMPNAEENARISGRKTIMEEDIIRAKDRC